MSGFWGFVLGLFVGGWLGAIVMAALAVAARADLEQQLRFERGEPAFSPPPAASRRRR